MFKLNLKIALRNLWKNKGYTFINLIGLAIGMASCILIFIFIKFHYSFDEGYSNEDRIYRLVTNWTYNSFDDYSPGVPIPASATAGNELAGVEKAAMLARSYGVVIVNDAEGKPHIKEDRRIFFTEPEFFDIFNLSWLAGSKGKEMAEPNTTVISESTAKRYYGSATKALGNTMQFRNKVSLKVVGVFRDIPENSSLPLEVMISFQTFGDKDNKDWESVSSGNESYVLLKKGVKLADLQQPLKDFNKRHYVDKKTPGNQVNELQPLRDIHFNDAYGSQANNTITKKELYGLGVIGLFLILTACINFINLATAQAINRSKEVGVRKVMGSRRKQLITYFLTETLTITTLALLIACVLVELAIPGMHNLFEVKVSFSLFGHPVMFLFMGLLVILVSFLAGFYPAMVMSGFSPALAIKNKVKVESGGLSMRKILVVVQFSITIILIISTFVILEQTEYMRKQPLGFASDAVLMINAPADHTFKEKVMRIAGVETFSNCVRQPLSGDMNTTTFKLDGIENKDFEVRLSQADEQYFGLFDLKIIAGQVYKKSDTVNGYVVNETFLKRVFITDPQKALGKIIAQNGRVAPIVGVVKDFNDVSLKEKISPMIIYPESRQYYRAAIKIDKSQLMRVSKEIELLWNRTFPKEVYYGKFVNDDIDKYYQNERVMGLLFRVFAGVIIFISFIGLFGLISFVASQRTKEVAIRKVLGASTYQLINMLNSSFLIMVLIANLVAWPLAYLFVSKWLSGFAYRMDLNIWPFALAMCISMLITLLTVTFKSYKAAVANTIDALKYE